MLAHENNTCPKDNDYGDGDGGDDDDDGDHTTDMLTCSNTVGIPWPKHMVMLLLLLLLFIKPRAEEHTLPT